MYGSWTNSSGAIISANTGSGSLLSLGQQLNDTPGSGDETNFGWTNSGAITATNAMVDLGGLFTQAAMGSLTFDISDTINLIGTIDDSALAAILTLTASPGSWNLLGGRIYEGKLATTGGAALITSTSGGDLDGVELTYGAVVDFSQNSAFISVLDGITLDSVTPNLSGNGSLILFTGNAQSVSGTGGFTLSGGGNYLLNTSGNLVTLAAGITVTSTAANETNFLYGLYNNLGTVQETASGGNLTLYQGASFSNAGILSAATGVLFINETLTNFASGTLTGGTYQALNGGLLEGIGGSISTNAATLILNGSGSQIYADEGSTPALTPLATNQSGASITIGGGYQLSISGSLSNAGTLVLGSTLTVPGNYTQSSSGALDSELQSATAYGQLAVSGSVTLAGSFNVSTLNGFIPAGGIHSRS